MGEPKRIWVEIISHAHSACNQYRVSQNPVTYPDTTEYIRADLYAELKAQIKTVMAWNDFYGQIFREEYPEAGIELDKILEQENDDG